MLVQPMTDMSNIQLTLPHVEAERIGYGRMGVKLVESLRNLGATVYDQHPNPTSANLINMNLDQGKSIGMTNIVCWASVPTHALGWWEGQIPTVLTMWEATHLPEAFQESLHEFDTIIVPSEHNLELFSNYHPNVRRINLGFDPVDWAYYERQQPEDFFYFLCGGSGVRKGVDLTLAAFYNTFPPGSWGDGPIPILWLKNPRGDDPEVMLKKIIPDADYSLIADRVQVMPGKLEPEDEIGLYQASHAYVQPSRGEGWGLQPLQAIAQGLPTILTDAHGHKAFAHLGWPVDWTYAKAENFMMGDAGQWWEPNLINIEAHMWDIYENYEFSIKQAKAYSELAHKHYTWEQSAKQLVQVLGPSRLTDYKGPASPTWREPTMKLYPITLLRDFTAHVAGRTMRFEKGKQYYETADIKRILFEANLLDPVCIDSAGTTDTGLLPAQVERAGETRGDVEF
jgi:glycosyltransferase involved in cell wall biosynthesis